MSYKNTKAKNNVLTFPPPTLNAEQIKAKVINVNKRLSV